MIKGKLRASLESIDFQSGAFYAELTNAFAQLKKLSASALKNTDAADPATPAVLLAAIIKNHTGMNVEVFLEDFGPCISIPGVNRNNPLINDFVKNFVDNKDGIKMIREAKGFARGSVNIRTGRVSGVFAETKPALYIPPSMIASSAFTAEELSAVVLHEVGHVFVYFEFIARSVRTNQVLAGVARALDQTSTQKDREVVLMSVKQALNLKEMDAAEVAKITDKKITEVVIITNVIKETRSEIGSNLYDDNNFEFLADQYASRQGASRALVTALDKLERMDESIAVRSMPSYLMMEAVKLMMLLGTLVTAASLPILVFIPAIMTAGIVFGDAVGSTDYDRPRVRFKRIRNDLVEAMKSKGISPELEKAYKEDIVAIDKILENVNDRLQFIGYISLYVFRLGKARFDAEKLQQDLEGFVANDLFGRSKDLKALA